MNTAMSLLMIRKVLNGFCAENGLSLKSAIAVDAARYLIKINSEEIPSTAMLQSSLKFWMAEQATAA